MTRALLKTELAGESDVVLARQRVWQIAGLLGFDAQDQTRIATAISEIARNAFQYAGRGAVEFSVTEGVPPVFETCIRDQGPGIENVRAILDGQYLSRTGWAWEYSAPGASWIISE